MKLYGVFINCLFLFILMGIGSGSASGDDSNTTAKAGSVSSSFKSTHSVRGSKSIALSSPAALSHSSSSLSAAAKSSQANHLMDIQIENFPFGNRTRNVRVYLPSTYASDATKRFPVLYMFDGQNLFDVATTAFGVEWGVDETIEQLITDGVTDGVIVVGIDNAGDGTHRYEEYTNWDWVHPKVGPITARSRETAAWLVNTIIPAVNHKYRTLTDRANTGLAGSSMGGYMTIYTGLTYPEIFGKLASFSTVALDLPMLGWNLRAYVEAAKINPHKNKFIANTKVYLDMGDQEKLVYTTSDKLIENHFQMCDSFTKAGFVPTCKVIAGGIHSESSWSTRFGSVLKLLFPK